jgi:excisionase family DNA binding protein
MSKNPVIAGISSPTVTSALLKLEQAATYCNISPLVISRAAREHRVEFLKLGKAVLFTTDALDTWIADNTRKAAR